MDEKEKKDIAEEEDIEEEESKESSETADNEPSDEEEIEEKEEEKSESKNKLDEKTETEDEKEEEDNEGSDKFFFITIGILVVLIIGIILIPKLIDMLHDKPDIRTYDDEVIAAYEDGETADRKVYNGFVFVKNGPLWTSKVQNPNTDTVYIFSVRFTPKDVENVTIIGNVDETFRTGDVYLTFDPYQEPLNYVALGAAELSMNLAKGMGMNVIPACTAEHPDCEGVEIVSCNTTDLPVIELVTSNETKIEMDGNCMKLIGTEFELLRVVDRLIFEGYGIMNS